MTSRSGAVAAEPAIAMRDVVKVYNNKVRALDGFDLDVEVGTVLGLLGPNGAGKTTVVHMLATILRPDEGRIEVGGNDPTVDGAAVRELIGLAGQHAAVDPNLTGRENLRLAGRLAHLPWEVLYERSAELLERFDLVEAADRLVQTYSGGMRRRLDLAAALVHRPSILFLDEPTTGLDPASRGTVWAMVRELVDRGTTVLLTTQYLDEAEELAGRIVVMDAGRAIAVGTPRELKAGLADTLAVEFETRADADRGARILAGLSHHAPLLDGRRVELAVGDGRAVLVRAVQLLGDEGMSPTRVAVREPSLDEVFLDLTGHGTTGDTATDVSRPDAAQAGSSP